MMQNRTVAPPIVSRRPNSVEMARSLDGAYTFVVFSHLRWQFVYQRPQQIMTRLAARHRVLFIEEPICDGRPDQHWVYLRPEPNVLVCQPVTGLPESTDGPDSTPILRPMLHELISREAGRNYVLWFYTPTAFPLSDGLMPRAVIYDCMDELSLFLHAPPGLIAQEDALLARADLVFTGGPSLFRAKQQKSRRVHLFPSSVDAGHYQKAIYARDPITGKLREHPDQALLPHPRLGFFGVIDERMDLGLLERLADAHSEWQIVMVGPVAKIEPTSLPRRPNLHWAGLRPYSELPSFLLGWDLCLIPFALNDATRFISPTKTLEYMAAEKMIVSTPIADVAEPYRDLVYIGATPTEFIQACEHALAAPPAERQARIARMHQVLGLTSWDSTAIEMERLIDTCLEQVPAAGILQR